MKKKNRNKKQGDLFNGFKPESEPKKEIITEKDVCRIFKGRVVSEKKAEIEARLIASGSWRKNVLEVENKIGNERGVYEWTLSGGEYYECQKVGSAEESEKDTKITNMEHEGQQSGEKIAKQTQTKGVCWFVPPDKERVAWYKKVFAEDEEKRKKKGMK